MTRSSAGLEYSFSMINLVNLMPEWSWDDFHQVMAQAGTNRVELVPSMLLGMDWDQQIGGKYGPVHQTLECLMQRYIVGSIQSLTYGLQINLADQLINHHELLRRLKALEILAKITGCSVLVLGSPGQKKLIDPAMSSADHRQRFMANCRWIANTLGTDLILSLEHNTLSQGAEYCNTLADIACIASNLRKEGVANVGVNLDTKCLVDEFGEGLHLTDILDNSELADMITSIQVSLDFLKRSVPHKDEDRRQLLSFSCARHLQLSLEEFGLAEDNLHSLIETWNS